MSKHKYSFTGDIEWNKFSQSELRKTAKKAGYQLSEDGNCFGICMSLVLYEQKHIGDTARESYLAKLNKKIEFPENNKKFYDKILLVQTQYQVNIPIKKHLISLDKILAPEPFISILPDDL